MNTNTHDAFVFGGNGKSRGAYWYFFHMLNHCQKIIWCILNPCISQYDLYRRLRLQFLVLLMMGVMIPETC